MAQQFVLEMIVKNRLVMSLVTEVGQMSSRQIFPGQITGQKSTGQIYPRQMSLGSYLFCELGLHTKFHFGKKMGCGVSDVLPPGGLDKIAAQKGKEGDGVPRVPAVVSQQGNLHQLKTQDA